MALVVSTKAHANLLDIDASEALQQKGVHAFFSHKDLDQHSNHVGPIVHDEEVFVSSKVTSQGQVLGAIIADDQAKAQRAARMVKVGQAIPPRQVPKSVVIGDLQRSNSSDSFNRRRNSTQLLPWTTQDSRVWRLGQGFCDSSTYHRERLQAGSSRTFLFGDPLYHSSAQGRGQRNGHLLFHTTSFRSQCKFQG